MVEDLPRHLVDAVLSEGPRAVVLRGRERDTLLPVAIKVLRGSRSASAMAAFEREIRLLAVLDHPGILPVLDHGRTERGMPWYATPLAPGGDLGLLSGKASWRRARDALFQILAALGHAHARGVIHRDIKPSNVLVLDGASRVVLADFGIAWEVDAPPVTRGASGSLPYMAPEQFLPQGRPIGPEADLYGVGALAWELLTGDPPFGRHGKILLREAHFRRPVPRLPSWAPAPEGLEIWLGRLLAKAPEDRFGSAAEAAWSLGAFPETPDPEPALVSVQRRFDPARTVTQAGVQAEAAGPLQAPVPAEPSRRFMFVPRPWRTTSRPGFEVTTARPPGASAPPFVGRLPERDRLWASLQDAGLSGRGTVWLLRGPSGIGKSALAHWLCIRALETGSASVLEIAYTTSDDEHALRRALRGILRCGSLDEVPSRAAARHRFEGRLEEPEVQVLEWLASPVATSPRPTGESVRAAFVFAVGALASERPLVVRMDDAHRAGEGLALLRVLADQAAIPRSPIVVVATAGEPAGDVEVLLPIASAVVRVIRLGPLADDEARELAYWSLGMSRETQEAASRTVDDAGGVPALLVGSSRRAAQQEGAKTWTRLRETKGSVRRMLEIAAVLGDVVDREELLACIDTRLPPLETDVLQPGERPGTIAFADVEARAMLLEVVHSEGRSAALHRRCATVLGEMGASPRRVAGHLELAGELRAACDVLLQAAEERAAIDDWADAHALLRQRARVLLQLTDGHEDTRQWIVQLRFEALALMEATGTSVGVEQMLERSVALARSEGLPQEEARSRLGLAHVEAFHRGRQASALDKARVALDVLPEYSQGATEARLLIAYCLGALGRFREVLSVLEGGWTRAAALPVGVRLHVQNLRGWALMHAGELEQAEALLTDAVRDARRARSVAWESAGTHVLGLVCMNRGRLDDAERHFRRALRLYRALGGGKWSQVCSALGAVHLARSEPEQARAAFSEALAYVRRAGSEEGPALSLSAVGVWIASAHLGDTVACDHIEPMVTAACAAGFWSPRMAGEFLRLAKARDEAGDAQRARRAREFASQMGANRR